jgi:hypothetical protein
MLKPVAPGRSAWASSSAKPPKGLPACSDSESGADREAFERFKERLVCQSGTRPENAGFGVVFPVSFEPIPDLELWLVMREKI